MAEKKPVSKKKPPTPKPPPRYEYQVLLGYPVDDPQYREATEDMLNNRGSAGWELISGPTFHKPDQLDYTRTMFYMRREIRV